MSTDAQLRDQAVALLQKTTDPYPTWVKKGKLVSSNWAKAFGILAEIGGVPGPIPVPPSPVPGASVLPPVGPFTTFTKAQWFRDVASPQGVSKVLVDGAADYGVAFMDYFPPTLPPVTTKPFGVTDVIGRNIGKTPPVMNGTGEAGLWFGAPVTANRVQGDGSWMGIWTGCTIHGSTSTNFIAAKQASDGSYTSPLPHVGIYSEHPTIGTTWDTGIVCSSATGWNFEWWYPDATYAAYVKLLLGSGAPAGKAGSCNNVIRNAEIFCPAGGSGVFEDAGTFGNQWINPIYWGPGDAHGLSANALGPATSIVNPTFLNEGKHIYTHNNAVGLGGRAAQPARALHPHTIRMPAVKV